MGEERTVCTTHIIRDRFKVTLYKSIHEHIRVAFVIAERKVKDIRAKLYDGRTILAVGIRTFCTRVKFIPPFHQLFIAIEMSSH